jgi:hypothetical protein
LKPALKILLLLLAASAAADPGLNVSIVEFDPGVPEDRSTHRDLQIFPRIREVEAMLLPFTLRETLANAGRWGAVRIVPETDAAAELMIEGWILQSDGYTLGIRVRAIDALGTAWIDKIYAATAGSRQIFAAVAADLHAALGQRTPEELQRIEEVSVLRYGERLAPSAFGDYLDIAADGTVTLRRLPSLDDPMVDRIRLIRETEYVITDAVDAKFRELHADIESVYSLWREYRRKTVEYEQQNAERAASTYSAAPRGSYEDLLNRYENYKYDRVTAQEQDSLAVAFNNEVGPTVQAMEIRVAELETWVARKYLEWNRLLEELFDVETTEGRSVDEGVIEDIEELLD